MKPPRLGIIGTGMISAEFAAASQVEGAFEIVAVMSRSPERAAEFARQAGLGQVAVASDVAQLVQENLDAVYIASPNSLHREHALAAIDAGVNVIVEKPAFWNPGQWRQVHERAERAGVLVLEAARNIFEPGFSTVQSWVEGRDISGVSLNFHQYSSRWGAVLAGQEPNIFSLHHGGGALTDLGIYAIYAAVAWLGEPVSVLYRPQLAPTGVDASGALTLGYPGFTAELSFSKNQSSALPSEIRSGASALVFNAVQGIDRVETVSGESLYLAESPGVPLRELMRHEVAAFGQLLTAQKGGGLSAPAQARYAYLTELSRTVNRICTEARASAGIVFTGESL